MCDSPEFFCHGCMLGGAEAPGRSSRIHSVPVAIDINAGEIILRRTKCCNYSSGCGPDRPAWSQSGVRI